jgi:uncharacterized membrane protein
LMAVAAVLCSLFLLAPGNFAAKIHLALHGVCAQRPSHSLLFAGVALPLDARMTGLYTGAATVWLWLIAAGRGRAAASLSRRVHVVLGAFVVALVLDGGNALLYDLGLPHPYAPSNLLRLGTGIVAGTSLGVVLVSLFAKSAWANADADRALVPRLRDLAPPLLIAGGLAALAVSGIPILYSPVAVGLLLAVTCVFSALSFTLLVVSGAEFRSHRSWGEMTPLAVVSLVVAVSVIVALAGARFLAETWLALPSLT